MSQPQNRSTAMGNSNSYFGVNNRPIFALQISKEAYGVQMEDAMNEKHRGSHLTEVLAIGQQDFE